MCGRSECRRVAMSGVGRGAEARRQSAVATDVACIMKPIRIRRRFCLSQRLLPLSQRFLHQPPGAETIKLEGECSRMDTIMRTLTRRETGVVDKVNRRAETFSILRAIKCGTGSPKNMSSKVSQSADRCMTDHRLSVRGIVPGQSGLLAQSHPGRTPAQPQARRPPSPKL